MLRVATTFDEQLMLGRFVLAWGIGLKHPLVLDSYVVIEGVGLEIGFDDALHTGIVELGVKGLHLVGKAREALADDIVIDGVEIFLYVALGHVEGVTTVLGTIGLEILDGILTIGKNGLLAMMIDAQRTI